MSAKRDQIIDTALKLFCARGFQGTGIDLILSTAGVAKMTLYKHFSGKDELILSALDHYQSLFLEHVITPAESNAPQGEARLYAALTALADWIESGTFIGSALQKAAAEFDDPQHPAQQRAHHHLRTFHNWILVQVKASGCKDPSHVAEVIMLIFSGVMTQAQLRRCHGCCKDAARAIHLLLDKSA